MQIHQVHSWYLEYLSKESQIDIDFYFLEFEVKRKKNIKDGLCHDYFVGRGFLLIFFSFIFSYIIKINNFWHSNDRVVGLLVILTLLSTVVLYIPLILEIPKFLVKCVQQTNSLPFWHCKTKTIQTPNIIQQVYCRYLEYLTQELGIDIAFHVLKYEIIRKRKTQDDLYI